MYIGRFTLGEEVVLPVHATAAGRPVTPDEAPSVGVYDASGTLVFSALVPGWDRQRSPGLFAYRRRLDGSFAPGRYAARAAYRAGGVARQRVLHFDVVAGGNADGSVVSMAHLVRPHADYLIRKTDAGKRLFGRSPTP